jgi:hypothetical protein
MSGPEVQAGPGRRERLALLAIAALLALLVVWQRGALA